MFGEKGSDEDIAKLREEIERLKEQLREVSEGMKKEPRGREEAPEDSRRAPGIYFSPEFGESIREYVDGIVDSVMSGIAGEMDRSIFVGPGGIRISRPRDFRKPFKADPKKVADVMSALGNEHRIRILEELTMGGLYTNELQERIPEISASTLSSHLEVLQRSGLIFQEKERGRYLITLPGRVAYRMASQISGQVDKGPEPG